MGILPRKSQQINTGCVGLIWAPPRPAWPLESAFLQQVLRAIDRLRRQCPGLIVCRIHWESRSAGHKQDFLSCEAVEFAPEEPDLEALFPTPKESAA
jgi:hypothetical protein